MNYKKGLLIGGLFLIISIAIGIFFENDIGFIIAGIGVIIIGFSILSYINN